MERKTNKRSETPQRQQQHEKQRENQKESSSNIPGTTQSSFWLEKELLRNKGLAMAVSATGHRKSERAAAFSRPTATTRATFSRTWMVRYVTNFTTKRKKHCNYGSFSDNPGLRERDLHEERRSLSKRQHGWTCLALAKGTASTGRALQARSQREDLKVGLRGTLSSDLPSCFFSLALSNAQLCQGKSGRTRVTF